MEIVKKYSTDDLSIIWKPQLCIHSENCFKALPRVFNPRRKPWIDPKEEDAEKIKLQIEKCPSGALSFENQKPKNAVLKSNTMEIQILENGPLLVQGPLKLSFASGRVENKDKPVALCRCGESKNKPYCDASHKKVDFRG